VLCSAEPQVSLAAPGGAATAVDPARKAEVAQAIKDWMERASRNAENMAVFYFCGHGLAFGETENALLLEDFGGDADNPMTAALAFDDMRMGLMRRCAAKYQVHFIDACRNPPTNKFLEIHGHRSTGDPVLVAGVSQELRGKVAPVYFATGLASAAYGVPGQASLFTQGLLQSMRGPASRDMDDWWEVQVPALAEGINKCVASMAFQAQPQYCQPRDTGPEVALHRLRTPPQVVMKVVTRDENLLALSVLAHIHETMNTRGERQPQAAPWWVLLESGPYRFEATSPGALPLHKSRNVAPPGGEVRL
jgi:hypothetical protein